MGDLISDVINGVLSGIYNALTFPFQLYSAVQLGQTLTSAFAQGFNALATASAKEYAEWQYANLINEMYALMLMPFVFQVVNNIFQMNKKTSVGNYIGQFLQVFMLIAI